MVLLSTIQRNTASSLPPVVHSTTLRCLTEGGLRSQWPLGSLPLYSQHRRNRLEWCCSRSSWLSSDWHRIVFNGESCFTFEADDYHLYVWGGQS
ncbi:transposable element Tcb2 transposase [Trichonephila clavipes]|nr:transposable element Tcb2 transposase [Trichonephila clavipes]